MAYVTLDFTHPVSGAKAQAPVGFSWTTLFFGFFVPLLRTHYVMAVVMLVVALLTGGLSYAVFPFFYNKSYIKYLVNQGYKVDGAETEAIELKLGMKLPKVDSHE